MSPAPSPEFSVLLQVTKGPTSHIHLRATVLEVSLDVSKRRLQFSDILVGQCQVETIRLYNWFQVPCTWFITASKPIQKRSYKNELKLNICGSSNYLKLHLSGQGLEPRLEFSPPALKMGPVLVDSNGVEATVVVKNPCNFPIEFYSLDFDEQYLEEEKILWMALGSEHQKSFLMPPRAVDGTLPPQVLEDCEAQKLKTQQAKLKARAKAQPSTANKGQKPKENVKKVKQKCGGQRSLQSSQLETQSQVAEGTVRDEHVGVPCLDMQDTHSKAMIWEILRDGKLPTKDQVKPCKAQILSLPWD
ncbi:hydrocephalus-inducing protein homolog [Haemorhous mexicanus]|uniref:hydrocephalus-inducing protein homolog n=1 Tax=Haemorhous mexicanus TaxID=30427 RepID=UPI0028BD444D|nr:hydrocephalus-inducing protein homolog [Haemorhous mexicanus]